MLPKSNTPTMTLVQELSDAVYEIPKPIRTGVLIETAALTVTVMWIHNISRVASSRLSLATCGRLTTVAVTFSNSFLSVGQKQERAADEW